MPFAEALAVQKISSLQTRAEFYYKERKEPDWTKAADLCEALLGPLHHRDNFQQTLDLRDCCCARS